MTTYKVKELYLTLQGEGAHTGRPAIFCRFTGCNLWSGRERDRTSAICQFCDTDFIGMDGSNGGVYSAIQLADRILEMWPGDPSIGPFVVLTGGEPLLQVRPDLIEALHKRNAYIAVETNGTLKAPENIDWICVSPKANAPILQDSGQEFKLVYPQQGLDPAQFENMAFQRFSLQPMDGPKLAENTEAAIKYCLEHPKWQLSIQTHKVLSLL